MVGVGASERGDADIAEGALKGRAGRSRGASIVSIVVRKTGGGVETRNVGERGVDCDTTENDLLSPGAVRISRASWSMKSEADTGKERTPAAIAIRILICTPTNQIGAFSSEGYDYWEGINALKVCVFNYSDNLMKVFQHLSVSERRQKFQVDRCYSGDCKKQH